MEKAFDKWLETQKPYDPFCCAGMAEAAWKEALKWFREKLVHYTVEDAIYFLEQELEEE